MNNSFDLESNFFNTHGFTNTTYFTVASLKTLIKENNEISFSDLYLNIRSLNKNFENLKKLLVSINFCVNDGDTETLCLEIIDQISKNIFINTIYRDSHLEIKKTLKLILVNFSKNQKPK